VLEFYLAAAGYRKALLCTGMCLNLRHKIYPP
jgi:hypothetical protein